MAKKPILSRVQYYVNHGWPTRPLIEALTPYWRRASELSVGEGCVLWGTGVIVPPQGQRVLEKLHAGYPGVARMKGLARTTVWWPRLAGTSNAMSKVVLVVKKVETRNARTTKSSIASLVLAPSTVNEGARGLHWILARKNASCTN